ncbi:hypothetical protein COLO4_11643 [Corchorus olitorius]|uniref:Uncharacterized protein n=1 Tax=Corchorus olitorius TaxID=93759 RepID=A0A1R3K3R1_9ROSI|nr:hypothetical protein COLO4_11643 [Corchorus olitorius]
MARFHIKLWLTAEHDQIILVVVDTTITKYTL